METTLEKIRFIESDAVSRKGVKIKALGSTVIGKKGQPVTRATSLQTTYPCGCVQVQHLFCGAVQHRLNESFEDYNRRQAEHSYHVELCPLHRKIFDKQMRQKEFIELRCQCLRIIRETITGDHDQTVYGTLSNLSSKICALPDTPTVRSTFKGIIGYRLWLQEQGRGTESFLEEALHDLAECIENRDQTWYAPRTESYVKYYKPQNNPYENRIDQNRR